MKTLFVIIYRGLIGRNIFRSDIFRILKNQDNLRIVLFLPPNIPAHIKQEFSGPNVFFEEIKSPTLGRIRKKVFLYLLGNHLFTRTTRTRCWFGSGEQKDRTKERIYYIFFWPLLFILSKFPYSRRMFQWLEAKFYPDKQYEEFFDKYRPDVVFSTSILSTVDIPFIKSAKRRGIATICLLKSWDNLDKQGLQIKVDKLLVQNQHLKKLAFKWHGYAEEEVKITGFPQFDIYSRKDLIMPREEFFKKINFDPNRKIIFFGSEGRWSPNDEQCIDVIYRAIREEKFIFPCSLIIRPVPSFGDINKKRYEPYRGKPNVYIDDKQRTGLFWPDTWDPTNEELVLFMNTLYYSDVTISVRSTLSLDAACLDKPIINPYFGAFINNGRDITSKLYNHLFYQDLLSMGGITLVKNNEELINMVNNYLKDSLLCQDGRNKIRKELCGPLDGQSGRRVAENILSIVNKTTL